MSTNVALQNIGYSILLSTVQHKTPLTYNDVSQQCIA